MVTLTTSLGRRVMGPLQPMLEILDGVSHGQPQNRKRSHSALNLLDGDSDPPQLNSTSGSGASSPACCSTEEDSPSSNGLSAATAQDDGFVTNYESRSGDESESDDGWANPVSECVKLERGLHGTPKSVPCSFLYDATGSGIYDEIVELDEYYPYKEELNMLGVHAERIVDFIPQGAVLVELGCGSATKTSTLLNAMLNRYGTEDVRFIGIDVSQDFLDNARQNMLVACPKLCLENVEMICKEYEAGMLEARKRHPDATLVFLWLGSSIGNMLPSEAEGFLRKMLQACGARTQLFLCADLWKAPEKLHAAYHDAKGVTERFIKNGILSALSCLPTPLTTTPEDWSYRVCVNSKLHQVEMYLRAEAPLPDILPGVGIAKGEEILMERSRKFTPDGLQQLATTAGFCIPAKGQWLSELYSMQMLMPAKGCKAAV